ncbi:MAG TPA: NirA family protein [Verrucomicrobiae bacterium]|jgi:ferredoxin-nitrite reductase
MKTDIEIPIQSINGEPLTHVQRQYLDGYFAGLAASGVRFSDIEPAPVMEKVNPPDNLILEERIKREQHPLDAYPQIVENAGTNKGPDKEDLFRFKWNGLFYLSPNKEAFMARLRIPGGQLKTFQLRELAAIAKELTSGYMQVTTRANLQLRLIQPKDVPEMLQRIQHIGLHTRGAGGDNIRNLTVNPTSGIDPNELIDVLPLCHSLAQIIINDRAFYDLPRKFNIAYDGGGSISNVEDTNDISARAVRVGEQVFFRIALGGATGHKSFAHDIGVQVAPAELNRVIIALVRVFLANGNRADRKKARLKHLLETLPMEKYLAETEKILGCQLPRVPAIAPTPVKILQHQHIGIYPQKQPGMNYLGVALPVGQLTSKQLLRIAEIADLYGSGEIRLTVWQNFIIPNVPDAYVETVKKALRRIGLDTQQSFLRGGLIACTGNAFCKYAQSNTKGHAAALADYLEKKILLDLPINIHLTGCPNSCAQHYIGDIGLLGTKVRGAEGYHVFVGGGFGANQSLGRQVFTGITFEDLKTTLEKMLKGYLKHRQPREPFQGFTQRHDLNTLQAIFSNEE